jgi:hypothetical protein
MEMTLGAIPRPGRVLEQRFLSPETCIRWRQRCRTFCGWRLILFRVFASGAIYRRKGGVGGCGHPGLPPGIPVMHTVHDPRKTVVNPHNRVGITEYIIHYITSSNSLTWPLGRIQMPRRASSTSIAADKRVELVARVIPLPYRRLTRRRILVHTGVVELLTIILIIFTII